MLYCIFASTKPSHNDLPYTILAATACAFFTYETYCLMFMKPGTLFGHSEQEARLFAITVICGWLVLCAYKLKNNAYVYRILLGICAALLTVYECISILHMKYD